MPKSIEHEGATYIPVGVASKEVGVAPATLKRWADPELQTERGFRLRTVVDGVNGRRFYHAGDIQDLKRRFK